MVSVNSTVVASPGCSSTLVKRLSCVARPPRPGHLPPAVSLSCLLTVSSLPPPPYQALLRGDLAVLVGEEQEDGLFAGPVAVVGQLHADREAVGRGHRGSRELPDKNAR